MSEQEYLSMKERYSNEAEAHTAKIAEIRNQMEEIMLYTSENKYLASFTVFKDATVLSREVLTALIERVEVGLDHRINIKFKYRDELSVLADYLRREMSPDEYSSKVSAHLT